MLVLKTCLFSALAVVCLISFASAQYNYPLYDGDKTEGGTASVGPTGTAAAIAPGVYGSGYDGTPGGIYGGGGYGGSGDGDSAAAGGVGEYRIASRSWAIAHAACGALATMLVLPAGVFVARYARGLSAGRWWFTTHTATQALVGFGLVCAAFGIAWAHFDQGLNTPHRKAAVAFFTILIVQALLGAIAHTIGASRFKVASTGRNIFHFIHWIFGAVVIGVGWAVAWLGLVEWDYRGHGEPSNSWRIGWGVVIGLWILLYLVGLVFLLPRQLKREAAAREPTGHPEANRPSSPEKGSMATPPIPSIN